MKKIISFFTQRTNSYFSNQYFILGLIYLFFFSYFLQVKLIGNDDFFINSLGKDIPLKNAFYMNARITSNLFGALLAKFNLIIWKVGTPFIMTLLIYSLSSIIIGRNKVTDKSRINIYIFVFLSMLYIYPFVFTSSVFWVAGSVSYIWPVSIGIYSFLHYIKFYKDQKLSFWKVILFLISAFYAAFGQEQISALLSSFSVLFVTYYFFEKRKIVSKYLIIQTIIYICGTIFLMSPFSHVKMQHDINLYYPDFLNITTYDKVYRGLIWLCNQLFNKDRFLIIIFLFLLILYNFKVNVNKISKSLITFLLLVPISILILSVIPVESTLNALLRDVPHLHKINFDSCIRELLVFDVKKYSFTSPIEYIRFIFWTFYLIAIPILTFFMGKEKTFNFRLFIILSAAFASSSIMFFAPSIYESKHRVFLTMDILIVLCIGLLFTKIDLHNSRLMRFFTLYSIYPVLIYFTLHWLWFSGYFVMH
jgi:hypothetical protein